LLLNEHTILFSKQKLYRISPIDWYSEAQEFTMQTYYKKIIFLTLIILAGTNNALPTNLTNAQKKEIGMRIWHNEAGGRYDQLVFWKTNEQFPSLGICHFIWYPRENADTYTQTFPDLIAYFKKKKVKLPAWLANAKYAPWKSKEEFDKVAQSSKVQELRKLMADTIDLQVEFVIQRLENAWPRIKKDAEPKKRKAVEQNFRALMQTPQGIFALIDYLNFKGEGTDPKERYNGMGWGLLQALETMNGPTIENFVTAAKSVLSARVAYAPPHKSHEKDWLQGWHNRVYRYLSFPG
jgi:hypothetical protein